MKNLQSRFHYVKTLLASVLLMFLGVVLVTIGRVTEEGQNDSWARLVPWTELGGIILGAGLLSIWIDYWLRREHDAMTDLRLRQIMHDHAPLMRDAVLDAFAANHQDLVRVATPETLDRIIVNSLAVRLGDDQFAAEIWHDIRDQAVNAPERRHNASLDINLSPLPGRRSGRSMSDATR